MDRPWVSLASLDTPKRENTTYYINTRQHELSYMLKDSPFTESLVFQSVDGKIRCRRGNDSSYWIIGQSDVESEIKQAEDCVNDVIQEHGVALLLGGSIGYGVAAIIPHILLNPELRVVVVEPSIDRILACLSFVDIVPALVTERLHFIVSDLDADCILKKLEPLNLFQYESLTVIVSPELQGNVKKELLITKYAERVQRAKKKRVELISEFKSYAPARDVIERVLLINCWEGAPQEIHLQAIIPFLVKRKIKIQILTLNANRFDRGGIECSRMVELRVIQLVREFQPDMILSFSYHAPHFVSRDVFDAMHVHWVQVVTNLAYCDKTQYPGEHTFVIEENMIPLFEKRGYHNVHFMPLMANYHAENPVASSGRFPIVILGNSLAWSSEVVDLFLQKWQGRNELLSYIKKTEQVLGDFDAQINAYEYLEQNPIPQIENEIEWFRVFTYFLVQSTAHRRIKIFEKLAPLGLNIFGYNWERTVSLDSPIRGCLRGYFPIQEERKIFSHGSVFINIQSIGHITGPNMRFFNTPGMGAFQVSDMPQFDCYLKADHEMVYASSLDEYYDKVQYYLGHKDERDEIRSNAQKRINRDWTYDNWIDRVFEKLGVLPVS